MGLQESLVEHLTDRPPHHSHRRDAHAYASEAGQCARKIALRIWHQSDPPTVSHTEDTIRLTGLLSYKIGETVHEAVQEALMKAYRSCHVEVSWDLLRTSGRADGVYLTQDGKSIVVEIKTKSPDQFKTHKKSGKPDFDNVLQAILGAMAMSAYGVHIIYINKASRYFESPILEWIYPLEDVPEDGDFSYREFGELEEERLARIVEDAESGVIPEPVYHGEVIVNPDKQFWPCAFCPFKNECKALGPQPVILERFEGVDLVTGAFLDDGGDN